MASGSFRRLVNADGWRCQPLHPHLANARLSRKRESAVNGSFSNTLPLAEGSGGLRWWHVDECADLQGEGTDCLNGRPGRVLLRLVGVANHFTLTSLRLNSPVERESAVYLAANR